jgi:alpha-D-ribose 1-methylphosphonate 5-triphosphate synthase subunit PhnH
MSGALALGFASPVRDAQAAFRAVLAAMAEPGRIVTPAAPAAPPSPLPAAMAAVALTLVDADTPLWLDAAARAGEAPSWLRFHCGCRIVADPAEASFAFCTESAAMPPMHCFATGTDEYPDGGATLVVAVHALGAGPALALSGPGIAGTTSLRVAGLPPGFVADRAANHRLFPRGVDTILVAGGMLAALPRSTAVAEG